MNPLFSIVIPLYNKEAQIAQTISAVLHQEEKDVEILIVNDGSTDNSEAEVLKFSDSRINYFKTENRGAAAARNYGITKAKGTFIAFLDADDHWEPFYLQEIRSLMQTFPDAFVYSTAKSTQKNNRIFSPVFSFDNPDHKTHLLLDYFSSSYIEPILHSSTCVVRRSIFEDIDMFDTTIKSGQDTDLWIRIGLQHKVAFSTRICATYRQDEQGLFKTTANIYNKINLDKFESHEKENPALKKYLDLNRFSLWLFCMVNGFPEEGKKLKSKIDRSNLNFKQRLLLLCNGKLLKHFIKIKDGLERKNIRILLFK